MRCVADAFRFGSGKHYGFAKHQVNELVFGRIGADGGWFPMPLSVTKILMSVIACIMSLGNPT